MIRTRFKKILLVAPDAFSDRLLPDYTFIKHISEKSSIFPCIFDLSPDLIIFDYDFLGRDTEKILRRIRANNFYKKIKICCYKNSPNEKIDSLLITLGADQLLYHDDFKQPQKNRTFLDGISTMFDANIMKWVPRVSN